MFICSIIYLSYYCTCTFAHSHTHTCRHARMHAHTHARTPPTHTHTRTHAHTHTCTHARTHARTHPPPHTHTLKTNQNKSADQKEKGRYVYTISTIHRYNHSSRLAVHNGPLLQLRTHGPYHCRSLLLQGCVTWSSQSNDPNH